MSRVQSIYWPLLLFTRRLFEVWRNEAAEALSRQASPSIIHFLYLIMEIALLYHILFSGLFESTGVTTVAVETVVKVTGEVNILWILELKALTKVQPGATDHVQPTSWWCALFFYFFNLFVCLFVYSERQSCGAHPYMIQGLHDTIGPLLFPPAHHALSVMPPATHTHTLTLVLTHQCVGARVCDRCVLAVWAAPVAWRLLD